MATRYDSGKQELNERQAKAATLVAEGMSFAAAAREAGYPDPAEAAKRLRASQAFLDAVLPIVLKKAASWSRLTAMAQRRLELNLREKHDSTCEVHDDTLAINERVCDCGFASLRPTDGNQAARIVLDVVSRTDPGTLTDKARKEDEAQSEAVMDMALGEAECPTS